MTVDDEVLYDLQDNYSSNQPIEINTSRPNSVKSNNDVKKASLVKEDEMFLNKEGTTFTYEQVEDALSQKPDRSYFIEGYQSDDINDDHNNSTVTATTTAMDFEKMPLPSLSLQSRRKKRNFLERIGLKKKYQTTITPTSTQEGPSQHFSDEEQQDQDSASLTSSSSIDSSNNVAGDRQVVPEISIVSPPASIVISSSQHSFTSENYTKTKTKHKKYTQEFSKLILAQTIATYFKPTTAMSPSATIAAVVESATAVGGAGLGSEGDHSRVMSDSSTAVEPSPNHPYGAIWSLQFSRDGQYLASAGQSCVVFLWKLFDPSSNSNNNTGAEENMNGGSFIKVLDEVPFRVYKGHTADVLDLSWSKNNFLLSSSMDNTVRLWHTSQKNCLCIFQHLNFVTSIAFHPKDDRYFLSGSMDGRIRIWSIPEKRVAFWNEIPGGGGGGGISGKSRFATAVGFTLDGKTVIAGSHDGHCYFYDTQSLKYNTQISLLNDNNRNSSRSSSSSSSRKNGPKVTGIEVMPGMLPGDEQILITSNDSRVRLYNMKDKSLMYKYKGSENEMLQIKATFSDDGRYIISGSEDCHAFIWKTEQSNVLMSPSASQQQQQQQQQEPQDMICQHIDSNQPQMTRISKWLKRNRDHDHYNSSKIRIKTEYFEAHDHVVTCAIFAPTKTRQSIAKSKQDTIYNNTTIPFNDSTKRHSASSGSISSFTNAPASVNNKQAYSDGHIIVTADFRGLIKVWRIDSGSYTNGNNSNSQQILPSSSSINSQFDTQQLLSLHTSDSSASTRSISAPTTPKSKRGFGNLFSGARQSK